MSRAALERRLEAAERRVAVVPDRRAEAARAQLAAAGIDLATVDNASLARLERLAETWPPELGDIPAGVIHACLGLRPE
jgi:hypothetical protein